MGAQLARAARAVERFVFAAADARTMLPVKVKTRFFLFLFLMVSAVARADSAADDLQAAQLLENAALTRFQNSADRAELEKVTQVYATLVQKYPRDANVREAYGAFLWQIERHNEAVAQWLAGENLDPKNAAIAFRLGDAFLAIGDVKKAVAYLARASELAPKNARHHFDLGNALYLFRHQLIDVKMPSDDAVALRAMEEFQSATKLEPFNVEFAKAYADAFYTVRAPDWSLAQQAWKHFLEISPDKDFAYTNLARVSLKMGHTSEARDFLHRITRKDFDRVKDRLTEQLEAAETRKGGL